jgi:RND superfamily putative drug exporter
MNALLERIGRFAARKHWIVVAVWLVVLIGLSLGSKAADGVFVNNYTVPGSESQAGLDRLDADFKDKSGYAGQIVFASHAGPLVAKKTANAISKSMANVGKLDHVVSTTDPFATDPPTGVSPDASVAFGSVNFDVVPQSLDASYLDELDKAVEPAKNAGLTVEYGGGAGQIGRETNDIVSEVIGLTCALILLLFMFMSFAAAITPLVAAIFSVGSGLALIGWLAAGSTFPTTAPTVATLLGLGVAVDYGLFLVARHREQVDHGMAIEDSIAKTEGTSGAAIVVAGGTVVIAILGLYVSGVPFVGKMGLASAIVVAVTVMSAVTLVPALISIAGRHIKASRWIAWVTGGEMPSDVQTGRHVEPDHADSGFARWGKMVSDNPWPWGIASTLVLLILAIPLLSLQLGQLDAGTDPTSDSSRRAYDLMAAGFGPGANGAISVVVDLDGMSTSDAKSLLDSTQTEIEKHSNVSTVTDPAISPSGNTGVMNVIPKSSPQDSKTTDLVNDLRDDILPKLDTQTWVVGTTAGYVDFTEKTASRMPYLIGAVVLLAMILLTVAFRSLAIALKAAVLNLLSVGAAYGVVVAVFQFGWGSQLIGIEQDLPIPAFVPMLMFAIVFGLSMDYEVFLLSRVHEEWVKTNDAHVSVAVGIGSTARVITTAASIMVVVFTSFVLSDDPTVKMLAVGMAVAVLIDASIVRMCLVPAIMSILGPHAWWIPRWLDKITPHIQLEEEPMAPIPPEPELEAAVVGKEPKP